jgi:hypothetical protein
MQANLAWAMGKVSHLHEGLLDAIAEQATAMVQVKPMPSSLHPIKRL